MASARNLPAGVLAIAALVILGASSLVHGADETAVSHDGVTIRILDAPFSGDPAPLKSAAGKILSLDQLPAQANSFPVLQSATAVVSCTAEPGTWAFWTRRQDQLTRQGEILLNSISAPPQLRIIADQKYGIALEMADRQEGQRQTIAMSKDGILEIRQPADRSVTLRSPLRYALVPSLVGTDLLYDPETLTAGTHLCLPSLNMLVGLQPASSGMLTAVWPTGRQLAQVHVSQESGAGTFDSFQLDTAGQPVFLSFIEQPDIWHAEPLREEYLEKETPIAWQKPFDARWIGRFFIDSDGYHFPFYFLSERNKLWGRYIRGWFYYPVWFDGSKSVIHFEKKFPPVGDLLIYYLDTYEGSDQPSPVGIMKKSLGKDAAAQLLDFEGTQEQILLAHHNAVCAMTYKIESYFARESEAPSWSDVRMYADDIATFIRLIRERVFQFDQFAADLEDLLKAERERLPSLADDLQPSEDILAEIRDIAANDLPDVSLEEVRKWTNAIQQFTPDAEKKSLAAVKALTQQCRSVAGTQDDMARNLSVVTIRLMEEAARMGTASPEHVRVAEQIIAKCRTVLRQPTWWEPYRRYLPKSNPGAP